jgi:hypothetical protein
MNASQLVGAFNVSQRPIAKVVETIGHDDYSYEIPTTATVTATPTAHDFSFGDVH